MVPKGAEYVRGPLQPTWAAQLADARRVLLGKLDGLDDVGCFSQALKR